MGHKKKELLGDAEREVIRLFKSGEHSKMEIADITGTTYTNVGRLTAGMEPDRPEGLPMVDSKYLAECREISDPYDLTLDERDECIEQEFISGEATMAEIGDRYDLSVGRVSKIINDRLEGDVIKKCKRYTSLKRPAVERKAHKRMNAIDKAHAREMLLYGYTLEDIGNDIGVSIATIGNFAKGLPASDKVVIERARARRSVSEEAKEKMREKWDARRDEWRERIAEGR